MANAKATDGPIGFPLKRTYRAEDGDLTRGYAVQQGTADDQVKLGGDATRAVGIVEESAKEDAAVSVVMHGECIGIAGGVVNAGDMVKSSTGKLVAANAADVETVGKAITSAAADTDEFVVFVNPIQKRS